MKRRLAVRLGVAVALTAFAIWAFFSYTERLFNHRVHKLEATFISDRFQLDRLAESWPHLQETMDPCGGPPMSPGLVHFASIGRTSDGKIRIAQDTISPGGYDVAVATTVEAAKKIGATRNDLSTYLESMDSISITGVYQHDAELHFVQDYEGALSLMYVPPTCKQYANYPFWNRNSNNNQLTPFALIHQLSPSWFLVEEKR